jgi:uncharacterized repeat protein (TIGR02543 family)
VTNTNNSVNGTKTATVTSNTATVTVSSVSVITHIITATAGLHCTISPSGNVQVNDGANQTFNVSYATGYKRSSLLVDGSEVNADTYTFSNVQGPHTIAVTAQVIVYTVQFTLNGGTGIAGDVTYSIETESFLLPTPTRSGYVFQGWYDNASFTGSPVGAIPAGSTGDRMFYAKWEAVTATTFTVTATAGPHVLITPTGATTVNQNGTLTVSWTFDTGYTLYQAKVDGVITTMTGTSYQFHNVTVNHTIEVTALPIVYTITYTLNGGMGVNNGNYTIESPVITLPVPVRPEYEFLGWYDNADFTGVRVVSIPAGSVGNRSFHARWEVLTANEVIDGHSVKAYFAGDDLFIEGESVAEVRVYSLSGVLHFAACYGGVNEVKISLPALGKGVYLVRISCSDGKGVVRKIMK